MQAQFWHYYNPTVFYDINAIEILGPGVIAIGGGKEANDSTQLMFQSDDYGFTWYENVHDGLLPWNKSIAFSDPTNGYAVGGHGRILKSDDAGRNWGWLTVPINRNLNKIVYAGSGTYFVVGGKKSNDSLQTIIETVDNGNNWYVIYDNYGPWLKSVFFIDTQKGFAVGDNGVMLSTTDGGSTWIDPVPPLVRDFNAIAFINADTGYIVGGSSSGVARKTILRTVDGGLNWSVILDAAGGILNDIWFADSQTGYIVGDSATVLKSIDGGLSWVPLIIDTALTGIESFNAVKFYNKSFGAIGGKAGALYIYTNLPVEVYALGADHIGAASATLNGAINTHDKEVHYSFGYFKNGILTPSFTQEVSLKNDSLILMSENINGLTPDASYHYFLRAITATDTVYSDTLSFFTGYNLNFNVLTLEATYVGNWQANLNGYINKCPEPINLYFEYGTSPALGSLIAATPSSVSDTLPHNIQTNLNQLQPNHSYFFRLKGVAASGIYYGDTKMFHAINLPWANTHDVSNLTLNSVQLNGNVSNNGTPAALKFDYGFSPLYGTEVNATPDSVFGTNNINFSYILNGLALGMTYHYHVKVINVDGTSFGDDKSFLAGGPSPSTDMANNITLSAAVLTGHVNANNHPTANIFEFGLTTAYGSEVTAIPDSASGNSIVNFSGQVTGLIPDTEYHFRVKATNVVGANYGYDVMFRTATPPLLLTLQATDITQNSAKLNGNIHAAGKPTAVKFEYGTTTVYGNEVVATPDTSAVAGNVSAFAVISGLVPYTTYHYRIKGTNSDTTKFGDDVIFYTGSSEIPNFNFEHWSPYITTKPQGWSLTVGHVTPYSPACHNNTAAKLMNDTVDNNNQPGAILIGNTYDAGQTFDGGAPFNARPDTLIGCFNYYIHSNDTALIFLFLKKQGVFISNNLFMIYGTSSGNYENLKFPVSYNASGNADTLILGMASSDFRHQQNHIAGDSYLIVDNIRFSGTTVPIPNYDFENWLTDTLLTLDSWWYGNEFNRNPSHQLDLPVSQTTDTQNGNFAVLLQNFLYPHPRDSATGWISTSKQNNYGQAPSFKVNARHKTFTGYYKFLPQNMDTMNIQLVMFKNHAQVGWGYLYDSTKATDYTPFAININYTDSFTVPDSGLINIRTCQNQPRGNSKLYIDNLNFDGFLSGIKEPVITNADNFDFNVYPNPFENQATVSFSTNRAEYVTVRLFDLSGKLISLIADGKYNAGIYTVNLPAEGLKKGFYICVINTERALYSKKLIVY